MSVFNVARGLCRSRTLQRLHSRVTSLGFFFTGARRLSDHLPGEPSENSVELFAKKLNVSDVEAIDVRHGDGYFSEQFDSFSTLGIEEWLVDRLTELGYKRPFEIQARTLPLALQGKDVIGRALTGSGKTLAFALPIVQRLMEGHSRSGPRAFVIAPTRELCNQVHRAVSEITDRIQCVALYGGAPYEKQERELRQYPDVICATPGRLNDHVERGNLSLRNVRIVILDEADELFTPNFHQQIEGVLEDTPDDKQMLLFSATMPRQTEQATKRYMRNPETIDLTSKKVMPSNIIHQALQIPFYHQLDVVTDILQMYQSERAIVFAPTKALATELAARLATIGVNAEPLHSDLSQRLRENCLQRFRDGKVNTLVATDVAARGLDVPEIDLVIQVGPPPSGTDYYIHRTGRTGRAGRQGRAILIYSRDPQQLDFVDEVSDLVDVEHIQPPSYQQVTENAIKGAVQQVKKFDQLLANLATTDAELLQEEMGTAALSAALAIIANVKEKRSSSSTSRGRSAFHDRPANRSNRYNHRHGHRKNSRYNDSSIERRWGKQHQFHRFRKQWQWDKKY
ncbi:DEAD-box ATP-dependent RNA helicase CshA-like [Corticium candelabrum]|uniref:DEAD-box ATP-dependent RNA helicase CshA-like n=1 Tax=Corticium candelabrum TaxID=121492 RepID=UPI002E27062D|nr:DEAD-box ATP-dependent RNA helicase CshA-like [Corticium candelabrum]